MNKKVYILTILVFVMAINAVFSQTTTKKLSYQAVVRNAANELVVNQNLSVEITILNANNVPQYKETHATVPTNQNGLLWLWVGDGTPTLGTMDNVVWKDATIKSVFTLPDGSTVEQNTPVTAMPYAYFADEVDTIFLQDYLTSHNYGNEDYVTQEELDDTLGHYTTTGSIDTLLGDYAKLIDLNAYEKKTDLCNDVINCIKDTLGAYYDTTDTKAAIHDTADVLRSMMVDAANDGKITIQKNNVEVDHFTVNQADDKAINITVPTTVAELTDADNYVTNAKLGDTLNAYYDTTDTKAAIHDTADVLRGLMVDAANDGKITIQKNNVEVDHFTVNQADDKAINITVPTTVAELTDADNYVTNAKLGDTLNAYYDTTDTKAAIHDTAQAIRSLIPIVPTNVSAFTNDAGYLTEHQSLEGYVTTAQMNDQHYLTSDSTVITTMQTNINNLQNGIKKNALCDSVNDCVHGWISDSTRMVIDSLNAYYDTTRMKTAIHDTANVLRDLMGDAANNATITIKKNNVEVDHFTLNQEADKAINITVPTTVAELTDAANYVTNAKLNDTLNAYYDTTDTKAVIHDTAQAIRSLIPIVPTNVSAFTNDAGYLTEHQSLEGYVTTAQMNDQHYLTSDSTVITTMQTNITNLQNGIKKNALCDSVNDCVTAIAKSVANDTANSVRAAIHDSLSSYKIKNCDDVTTCVDNALKEPTSTTNHAIDSIASNVIHDSIKTNIQTNINKTIHDSIVNNISAQIQDTVKHAIHDSIKTNIQTNINKTIHDSIVNNISAQIQDTVKHAIHDSLSNYKIKDCADVVNCVDNALKEPSSTTNHAIDSIASNIIHDSIVNKISAQIHDSIGNGTLTIQKNGTDVGTFKANQKNNQTLNIEVPAAQVNADWDATGGVAEILNKPNIPTTVAALTDHNDYATKAGNNPFTGQNTFSNKNTFTDTNYVEKRGFSLEAPNKTTENNCQVMVNACDLLDLFNNLNDRIVALEAEVTNLKSTTPPVYVRHTFPKVTSTTIKTSAEFLSPVADITSYTFCISTNANMNNPIGCYTQASEVYTFENLTPNTNYYITVSATNLAGTTVSDTLPCRTLAQAPTAETRSVTPKRPQGFQVEVSGLNFKEPATGTVQICCKEKGDGNCEEDQTNEYTNYTICRTIENATNASVISEHFNTPDIDLTKEYCVVVKVSNIDSTTVYGPYNVTPANLSLSVEGTESVTYSCGLPNVQPQYNATLSTGENANDYTFEWTGGTAETTDATTYSPSFAEVVTTATSTTKKVLCKATHNTEGFTLKDSVDVSVTNNPYTTPVIALCVDQRSVFDKGSTGVVEVNWGDNNQFVSATTVSHDYDVSGDEPVNYTITVKSAQGCEVDTTITTKVTTLTPCTVTSGHPAQTDLPANSTNGLEAVNGEGKIVSVKDYDGTHEYSVVQIGNQCWMAENLRTTHYGDGTEITVGSSASAETPYIYYPNGEATNLNEYGYLYNWQAATYAKSTENVPSGIQGVCPAGWHIPSEGEWQILDLEVNGSAFDFNNDYHLGGNFTGKLAKGCSWEQSTKALAPGNHTDEQRNSTGFGAVPAGWYTSVQYTGFGMSAAFWTCTDHGENKIYTRHLNYDTSAMNRPSDDQYLNQHAYSVRCLRDANIPIVISYTADKDNLSICPGEQGAVTYTVNVNKYNVDLTESGDYTYEWSVSPTEGATLPNPAPTGSSCQVTFSGEGTYTVSCTVKQGTEEVEVKSIETPVIVKAAPVFTTCENGIDANTHIVKLMSLNQTSVLNWGDNNSSSTPVTVDTSYTGGMHFVINGDITHNYDQKGSYTITATSNNTGCSTAKEIALGNATNYPCTIPSEHPAQSGTPVANTTHVEGKEVTNSDKIVSVQDYDGNEYPVVQIGSQCWMAENLRTTHYSNGDAIENGIGHNGSLTQGYYYPANSGNPQESYGNYYNWYATTRGIQVSMDNPIIPGVCPTGWHVPSKSEWEDLLTTTHASDSAVKLAKSCDWTEGNVSNLPGDYNSLERNAYGFGALPADWYLFNDDIHNYNNGHYDNNKSRACFWSSSTDDIHDARYLILTSADPHIDVSSNDYDNRVKGMSVRCVRNETSELPIPTLMSIDVSGNMSLCGGTTTVTYTAVVNANGTNIADNTCTYQWSITGNSGNIQQTSSSQENPFTVTYTGTGSYTVACTVTTPAPSSKVLHRQSDTGIESGVMPVDFTISKPGTTGTEVMITFDGTNQFHATYIDWGEGGQPEDVHLNYSNTISHTYTGGNGTYNITAMNGSPGYYCTITHPVTIIAPVLSVTPSSGNVTICSEPQAVTYTAHMMDGTTDATDNFNYSWSVTPPSGCSLSSSSGTTVTVTYSAGNTYTVSCTASPKQGSGNLNTSTNTTVTDKAPSFTVSNKTGRTVTLTLSNPQNVNTVTWGDGNSTSEITAASVSHTYAANSTEDGYTIIASNTEDNCVKSQNVPVSLSLDISSTGYTGICTGGSAAITYTAAVNDNGTAPATGYTYQWSVDPTSGAVLSGTGATVTVTYSAVNTYTVSCTAHAATGNVSNSVQTSITSATPSFNTPVSVNGATVTLETLSHTNRIIWDNNNASTTTENIEGYPNSAEHTYTGTPGEQYLYTIVAIDTNTTPNCSTTVGNVAVTIPGGNPFVCGTSTVSDFDGNLYHTVNIGDQCWLKENMRATHYSDGTELSNGTVYHNQMQYYYYYPGNNSDSALKYGYYYNWTASVRSLNPYNYGSNSNSDSAQGICPTGWHVPSKDEWAVLVNNVNEIAGKLAVGDWNKQDVSQNATNGAPGNHDYTYRNSSGFSALPAGGSTGNNNLSNVKIGNRACFWTSTNYNNTSGNNKYDIWLGNSSTSISNSNHNAQYAFSVRCIRDPQTSGGGGGQETPTIDRKVSCVLSGTNDNITTSSPSINIVTYSNNKVIEKGDTIGENIIIIDSVSDFEGNWYKVVQIGSQCWLKENMRATKYSDGTSLEQQSSTSLENTTRYYYCPGNKSDSVQKYGYLYNWTAAVNCSISDYANNGNSNSNFEMAQGICPTGWHIPTDNEWKTLETYLNGGIGLTYSYDYLGTFAGKLAYGNWKTTNNNTNIDQNVTDPKPGNHLYSDRNSTGFTALPAGQSGSIIGINTVFWTSTNGNNNGTNNNIKYNKFERMLHNNNQGIRYYAEPSGKLNSVRCIRD